MLGSFKSTSQEMDWAYSTASRADMGQWLLEDKIIRTFLRHMMYISCVQSCAYFMSSYLFMHLGLQFVFFSYVCFMSITGQFVLWLFFVSFLLLLWVGLSVSVHGKFISTYIFSGSSVQHIVMLCETVHNLLIMYQYWFGWKTMLRYSLT